MTASIAFAGYVMFDTQKTAIYGVGASVDEAWQDVMSNCDRPTNAFTGEPISDDAWFEQFKVSGASKALLDMVNDKGGDIAWHSVGGVACTEAEFEAANA